jgi:small subunit ribosomal protein S2
MGGIKNMTELPAAIFVVDTKEDHLAIEEARKQGVPVIAMVDTNSDPSQVNYPIPANDDAVSSIKLILGAVAKALK